MGQGSDGHLVALPRQYLRDTRPRDATRSADIVALPGARPPPPPVDLYPKLKPFVPSRHKPRHPAQITIPLDVSPEMQARNGRRLAEFGHEMTLRASAGLAPDRAAISRLNRELVTLPAPLDDVAG